MPNVYVRFTKKLLRKNSKKEPVQDGLMRLCKWHREERATRAPTCGEQGAFCAYREVPADEHCLGEGATHRAAAFTT